MLHDKTHYVLQSGHTKHTHHHNPSLATTRTLQKYLGSEHFTQKHNITSTQTLHTHTHSSAWLSVIEAKIDVNSFWNFAVEYSLSRSRSHFLHNDNVPSILCMCLVGTKVWQPETVMCIHALVTWIWVHRRNGIVTWWWKLPIATYEHWMKSDQEFLERFSSRSSCLLCRLKITEFCLWLGKIVIVYYSFWCVLFGIIYTNWYTNMIFNCECDTIIVLDNKPFF